MNDSIILKVRTLLYKSLAISMRSMESLLHSVKFTAVPAPIGAPLAQGHAENTAQSINNGDGFMLTNILRSAVMVYPFFCSA